MRRDTLNFVVEAAALAALLTLAVTGLIVRYVLPPGSRGGQGLSVIGLTRHEWGAVHFWAAVALAAFLVLHVILHWTWICVVATRWVGRRAGAAGVPSSRVRNSAGAAFFLVVVALIAGLVWVAAGNVEGGGGPDGGQGRGRGAADASERGLQGRGWGVTVHISGNTTLAEAAQAAGVDVATLREMLGLPGGVGGGERLGRVRQRYGVEIETVRRIVAECRSTPATESGRGRP